MQLDEKVQLQVRETLKRFNDLVSTRSLKVLAEFAPGDEVLLIGSESGEIARGKQELEAFFTRIFAREASYSWEWEGIEVSQAGDLAWLFADGWAVLSTADGQRRAPYRITGVLERHGERWLWRQFHGSEPVISKREPADEAIEANAV
jgi:ketosteroid isomerase-like protein